VRSAANKKIYPVNASRQGGENNEEPRPKNQDPRTNDRSLDYLILPGPSSQVDASLMIR
jgi:hypothetical protein